MQRPSTWPYTQTDPPGATIHKYRMALDWSQRTLADKCDPPLDHTTVRRVEQNLSYTRDTLERIAAALGVTVQDLFLPPELANYAKLPEKIRQRIADTIEDAAAAHNYKSSA